MKKRPHEDDPLIDEGPSKSELKRQSEHWQQLGEQLMALDDVHWAKLPLSETLVQSLIESKRIKSHEGLRRHRQYIGKLMRNEQVAQIADYLAGLRHNRELNTRAFHALEQLRERLIAEGNEAVGEVIGRYPQMDTQKLRQLVRQAKREHAAGGHQYARELFRFLRDTQEAHVQGSDERAIDE